MMRRSEYCTGDTLFLKFLFYVLKFLGLAPLTIDASHTTEKINPRVIRFVSSKPGMLYNGILACLTIYIHYIATYYIDSSVYDTKNVKLEMVIDEAQSTFAVITCTFTIINLCVRQKRAVTLANQLSYIHEAVVDLTIDVGDNAAPNTIISCVMKIVYLNFGTTIIWISLSQPENYQDLSYFIFTSFYNIVIHAMLLHYSLVLKLLHQLYRLLNAYLLSLLGGCSIYSDNNIHLMTRKLKKLRQVYVTLCRASRDISDFYSLSMLICVTHVFFTVIFYCHYAVMRLILWNVYEEPIFEFLRDATLIDLLAVSITILVRAAGVTVVESEATGEIVSELLMHNCPNHEVERQLQGFSNYLLHKDVHFSVFNLFPLNESLLISIVGSITTYLVILLEYEEDSKKENI